MSLGSIPFSDSDGDRRSAARARIESLVASIRYSDLRFADHISVTIDPDAIVISNTLSGASCAFARGTYELLDLFTTWTSMEQLVELATSSTHIGQHGASVLDVVGRLAAIDVLTSRKSEMRNDRLTTISSGWTDFLKYMEATRTTKGSIYAAPETYNENLAQKALFDRQPSAFSERVDSAFIALPDPWQCIQAKTLSFTDVMLRRRTARRYSDSPITDRELSLVLYLGWGAVDAIENPLGDVFLRKTSPSGGSLHSIEVYPVIMNVANIEPGCYHYSVRRHGLEQISQEDPREWIVAAAGVTCPPVFGPRII